MPYKIKRICAVCSAELAELEAPQMQSCSVCGREFAADTACENVHHVCYACKRKAACDGIICHCLESDSTDPIVLALELMHLPHVWMHGPEHHLIVPAALLTAFHNATGKLDLPAALADANARSIQVPGGTCGAWGACGAALGAGMFFGIATETTSMSTDAWTELGEFTAACTTAVAKTGGPRCCKRDSFTSLRVAVPFSNDRLGTNFPMHEITCEFFPNNRECKGKACPFFPAKTL